MIKKKWKHDYHCLWIYGSLKQSCCGNNGKSCISILHNKPFCVLFEFTISVLFWVFLNLLFIIKKSVLKDCCCCVGEYSYCLVIISFTILSSVDTLWHIPLTIAQLWTELRHGLLENLLLLNCIGLTEVREESGVCSIFTSLVFYAPILNGQGCIFLVGLSDYISCYIYDLFVLLFCLCFFIQPLLFLLPLSSACINAWLPSVFIWQGINSVKDQITQIVKWKIHCTIIFSNKQGFHMTWG